MIGLGAQVNKTLCFTAGARHVRTKDQEWQAYCDRIQHAHAYLRTPRMARLGYGRQCEHQ